MATQALNPVHFQQKRITFRPEQKHATVHIPGIMNNTCVTMVTTDTAVLYFVSGSLCCVEEWRDHKYLVTSKRTRNGLRKVGYKCRLF